MNKPTGYDEVQVGEFTPATDGGHTMVIKGVREEKSKTGKDMVVVAFDFDKSDVQPGYFADLFEKDIRPEKKWPNTGTQYILTLDGQTGKTSKSFKSFITSFEKSNNVECTWGANFCEQFKGKRIGGVFGIVEEEYNGKINKRHKLRWFCEYSKAKDAPIPEPKLLNTNASAAPMGTGFVNVADGSDEEIPF